MSDLLPCPFCGSRNVAQGASNDRISVWCFCGARGPDVAFSQDCIDPVTPIKECHAAWNRRAPSSSPAPGVETTWHSVSIVPNVAKGDEGLFVVAVRRARTGKVHTFPAMFLHDYPIYFDGPCGKCPGEGKGCASENGDGCPMTGWYSCIEGGEYDYTYSRLHHDPGDEHIAWCDFPAYDTIIAPLSQPAKSEREGERT